MATEIGPIDIQLTASGISEVVNAFKNVEDRVVAMERRMTAMGQQQAKARVKTSQEEAKQKATSAKQEETDVEKAEKAKTTATQTEAKRREDIIRNSSLMAGRYAAQQANEEIREAQRSATSRAAIARQLAGRIVGNMRSMMGTVTGIFGALTALGGGFSIAGAYGREMAISRAAQDAALTTHVPGKPGEAVSAATLEKQARQTAKQFNVHPEDVLASQKELMSKSSMGTSVLGLMPDIVKLSKAENTGQDPAQFQTELSRTAGILIKQGMAPEHVMSMLRGMVGQGRATGGTVEFSEMANKIPQITSQAGFFEGNKEGNALKLVSLFQSATKVTGGNVDEAATAVERLTSDALKRDKSGRSKVEKFLGHSITTKEGKVQDPFSFIPEIFQKSGGDIGKLENAGFEIRSNKLLTSYLDTYQKAESIKRGSGAEAVHKEMLDTATTQLSKAEVDKDYEQRRMTAAEKSEKVWNDFDEVIREKLIPVVTSKLIPALSDLIPAFSKILEAISGFIKWAADNPWQAIAVAGAAAFAKAIAVEVLASGARSLIAKALGGGAAGSAGIPGMGTAAVGIGAGLITAESIYTSGIASGEGKENAANLAAKVRAYQRDPNNPNAISPEAAQKQLDIAKAQFEKDDGTLKQMGDWALHFAGDKDWQKHTTQGAFVYSKEGQDLQLAIDQARAATKSQMAADKMSTAADTLMKAAETLHKTGTSADSTIKQPPGPTGSLGSSGAGLNK